MRTLDLSPLFRSSVGFDRMTQVLDSAMRIDEAPAYPPYNIVKLDEDRYGVTMAVAGFSEADLTITVQDQTLTVTGKIERPDAGNDSEIKYLHKGIGQRAFQRRFQLADHIQVEGAVIENGLLHVDLLREVPEALKPRTIAITTSGAATEKSLATGSAKVIESKVAA